MYYVAMNKCLESFATTNLASTKLNRSVLGVHVQAGWSSQATTILFPTMLKNSVLGSHVKFWANSGHHKSGHQNQAGQHKSGHQNLATTTISPPQVCVSKSGS